MGSGWQTWRPADRKTDGKTLKEERQSDRQIERLLLQLRVLEIGMRRSRKFCQRGSNFDVFFSLFDEGRKGPNTTFSGQSTARELEMAFGWRADDRPTVNTGLVAL